MLYKSNTISNKKNHFNTSNSYNIIKFIIARGNATFIGIDYTFRHTISHLLNNNEKEEKNNNQKKQRKNDQKIKQHISDLEKTISLNKDCINRIIPSLLLKQDQKKILLSSMEKIMEYFEEKKNYRNKMNQINSKILMNKQIIEEIKRSKDENIFIHKDQIDNLSESVRKKGTLVKQFYKKFSEVEIFIQRECKTPEHIEKYGHWTTFTIIPFMKLNEEILKRKYYYEYEVNKKKELIENLEKDEIKEIKNIEKFEKIKNYYENKNSLINRKIELLKFRLNIISNSNTKKSLVPTFKSKNPISSLDVKLNLLDPHVVELNLKNEKKLGEYQGILNEKNMTRNLNDNDIKEINDKFEEEIKKEEGQNDIKNENNDLNGLNEFDNISDIEDDKEN